MSQQQADPTERCPLCGEPFGLEPLNDDHVFGEAFGGRAKVRTHRKCNNDVGRGPEGRMHRPSSILSLFKVIHGVQTKPMRGKLPDGTEVDADLAGNTWGPARPTVSRGLNADGKIELSARASEKQMRQVLNGWRKKWPGRGVPTFDQLTSLQKEEVSDEPDMVEVELVVSLEDHLEVLKKVALGCGVLAFGPTFATSSAAAGVRCASLRDAKLHMEALSVVWKMGTTALRQVKGDGIDPEVVPDPLPAPKHQAVFMPMPNNHQTAVIVHILGYSLLPWSGIVVDGELPEGRFGARDLPVMIREDVGPYAVYDLQEIVMEATLSSSLAALQDEDE